MPLITLSGIQKNGRAVSVLTLTPESSGVQCQIVVPWKIGHQYKLDVSKNGNLVTGVVTDLTDGSVTTVGVIEVSDTFCKLSASLGFKNFYKGMDNFLPVM
ncbi:hypothetical protein [Pectobacterium versatile]|uniref:hypothetical protein n=1 Tax=Pectobacterium versatile TaxID=2488639 RepID=UPI001CCDA6C4|nr:hypothetical protein [Pectobacterium versatile]